MNMEISEWKKMNINLPPSSLFVSVEPWGTMDGFGGWGGGGGAHELVQTR
jgi:hypothetical protein